ncbi:MAG: response regulator [Candidatus Riflebacteria bacterium]|nr:response regulator [Candidatus Riflebacteria bacterium]
MKIMIVDDESVARRLIKENLEMDFPEISFIESSNGHEALKLFSKLAPEIVISDINMPGMNGLRFLSETKKLDSDCRFIFITGRDDTDSAIQALKLGAFDYLRKPLEIEELSHVLKNVVKDFLLEKELHEKRIELENNLKELLQTEINLNRALKKEKEAGEMKTIFISTVSHEFKTPLTSIKTSAEVISNLTSGNEKCRKYLQFINSAVTRINELVEDVLCFGQAEEGLVEFNPSATFLPDFCNSLIEEISHGYKTRNIVFVAEPSCRKNFLLDKNLVGKILSNLIVNALNYSQSDTEVLLAISQTLTSSETFVTDDNSKDSFSESNNLYEKTYLKFSISDKGIGIPEDQRDLIFQPFFRASNAGKKKGTGLGLAIVKKAVECCGGRIDFESSENNGTTFNILIPTKECNNT